MKDVITGKEYIDATWDRPEDDICRLHKKYIDQGFKRTNLKKLNGSGNVDVYLKNGLWFAAFMLYYNCYSESEIDSIANTIP